MVRPTSRKLTENLICLLVLLLTPLPAFLPMLTNDAVPLNLKTIFFQPPWEEARPAGLEPVTDAAAMLHAQRIFPSRQFISETFAEGDSVLWRPAEGLGAPFFALWRTRCLSPFSLPFYFIALQQAIVISAMLKLIIAGWCAFYAARRFAFPPAMALLVALAFQMSGPIYLWSGLPLSDVTPWLPILLVCAERLILGQFRAWALTAVVVAVMGLGGDPETLTTCLLFALVYFLVRRLRDPGNALLTRAVGGLVLGVLAGLAMIAVQLVPYFEYLTEAAPAAMAPHFLLVPRDLLAVFVPSFIDPARADAAAVIRLLHVGVLQVFLLALWLALRRFLTRALRRRMEALLLSALVLAALAFLAGPASGAVTWFGQLQPQHFLVALPLAFAFMAAAAVEEWNELNPEQCKATLARLFILIPVVWGVAFASVIVFGTAFGLGGALWPGLLWMVLAALVVAGMLGITLFRPNVRVAGYALCVVTFVLQWVALGPYLPRTEREHVFPATTMIRSLQNMETRIGGSETLKQWPLSGNGISQIYAPGGALLQRYDQFMQRAEEDPLLIRRTGARALLLTKEDIQEAFAHVRPVLHIQEVYPSGAILFRDLDTIPRARMVYAGQTVEDFSPELLKSELPPVIQGESLPESYDGPVAQATIQKPESNNRVAVDVAQTRRGMLVLADTWYPGWTASVDGEPAEVVPVDGIFRGVMLDEGEHEVVFEYSPWSVKLGLGISVIAFILVVSQLRYFLPQRKNVWEV